MSVQLGWKSILLLPLPSASERRTRESTAQMRHEAQCGRMFGMALEVQCLAPCQVPVLFLHVACRVLGDSSSSSSFCGSKQWHDNSISQVLLQRRCCRPQALIPVHAKELNILIAARQRQLLCCRPGMHQVCMQRLNSEPLRSIAGRCDICTRVWCGLWGLAVRAVRTCCRRTPASLLSSVLCARQIPLGPRRLPRPLP